MTFQGAEEVAHSSYHLVFKMLHKGELRSREVSYQKPDKQLVVDGAGVALKEKDVDVLLAFRRRALVVQLAKLHVQVTNASCLFQTRCQ